MSYARSCLFVGSSLVAVFAAACHRTEATQTTEITSVLTPATTEVTLLATADENGYVEARDGEGGALALLRAWTTQEDHCAGRLGAGGTPACPEGRTLALSTGDHFNGAALSSFFEGEPIADVMRGMGYAASALGNHDFDYGQETYQARASTAGLQTLAANVVRQPGVEKGPDLAPFAVFERGGAHIAVVGLASMTSAKTSMNGRFEGLDVQPYEEALSSAIPAAWRDGADGVIVIAHECPTALEPIFARHADWDVKLVVGAHCKEPLLETKDGVTFSYPGKHMASYLSAKLIFDPAKPAHERIALSHAANVRVTGAKDDVKAPSVAEVAHVLGRWQGRLEQALGEEIGFARKPLAEGSPELGRWVTTAIRESLHTDLAIVNAKALRAPLGKGPITKSTAYSLLPFDNSLLVVKLTGEQLLKELENPNAVVSGVTKAGAIWRDRGNKPIDPNKTYSIATVEYLYFGGDGFHFEQFDPSPGETGMVWQTALIDWTRSKKTSKAHPLDAVLRGRL